MCFLSASSIGELVLPSAPHFLWVTEFPLFSSNDKDKEFLTRGRRWSSTHHPFTAPMYEDLPAFYAGDYGRVRGQHYDIVLNGVEIGGGSVRIHDPAMQEYVFQDVLQVSTHRQQCLFSFHLPCTHLLWFMRPWCAKTRSGSCVFWYLEIFHCTGPSGQFIPTKFCASLLMPLSSPIYPAFYFFSPLPFLPTLPTKLWLTALLSLY